MVFPFPDDTSMYERVLRLVSSASILSTVKLGITSWFGLDVSTGLQTISLGVCPKPSSVSESKSLVVTLPSDGNVPEMTVSGFTCCVGGCGRRLLGGFTGSGLWRGDPSSSYSPLSLTSFFICSGFFWGGRLGGFEGLSSRSSCTTSVSIFLSSPLLSFSSLFTGVQSSLSLLSLRIFLLWSSDDSLTVLQWEISCSGSFLGCASFFPALLYPVFSFFSLCLVSDSRAFWSLLFRPAPLHSLLSASWEASFVTVKLSLFNSPSAIRSSYITDSLAFSLPSSDLFSIIVGYVSS